jgi:hypothetical protein
VRLTPARGLVAGQKWQMDEEKYQRELEDKIKQIRQRIQPQEIWCCGVRLTGHRCSVCGEVPST